MVNVPETSDIVKLRFNWLSDDSVNVKAVTFRQRLGKDVELLSRTFNLPPEASVRDALIREKAGEFVRELLGPFTGDEVLEAEFVKGMSEPK